MSETFQGAIPLDEAALLLNAGGWLPANAVVDPHTLTSLVKEYQLFFGLYADGILGPATLESLHQPRFCAHPDRPPGTLAIGGGLARWGKKHLKVEVVGNLGQHDNEVFAEGVIAGARTWSKYCGITFELVKSGGDIAIDGARIDGPGGVLAYAQLPSSDGFTGRLTGRWGSGENWPQIIVAVSAHEFGHFLGLQHTGVLGQLMNPVLSRYAEPQAAWDRPQAVARYGHPSSVPTVPPTTPPTAPPISPDEWRELGWMPGSADFQFNVRWRGSVASEELLEMMRIRDAMTMGLT